MFIILMVAMVSQLYTYVKTHLVVRFRYMYLTYYTSIMSQHWNKKKSETKIPDNNKWNGGAVSWDTK